VNLSLFKTFFGKNVPPTDARNSEGAPAYRFTEKHALAQYAATGCLNATFYATAEAQLESVLRLCDGVPAEFVAKTAVYCRERGFMKDLPALLCAVLTVEDPALCERIFDRVIDDGKMLRNFVQILRSGVVGRKSLGSLPKRLVQKWFATRDDAQVLRAAVGQTPSLADVLKMAHPKPATASRRALYGYLLGKPYDAEALPEVVRRFEAYKAKKTTLVPDVPFQMLTALELGTPEWAAIARQASWQQLRMNLNTFARHGVFAHRGMVDLVAARLRDREAIARSRVLPYQLMTAYLAASEDVPAKVRSALEEAMEIALGNVPELPGKVYVCPDVSGSMSCPVTGYRRGAATVVRCIDVAALMAAAILHKNPDTEVLPFEHQVVSVRVSRKDSVMTNARRLAGVGGGGTSCSAPLELLNHKRARGEMVILVSDNESWVDAGCHGTAMMQEWSAFKARNPSAKLVCIDLVPNRTSQVAEGDDVLNIGGFSDAVFEVVTAFATGGLRSDHWVGVIEDVTL
jgi:60 kDa SS-A/Ro ribonucleoprotein